MRSYTLTNIRTGKLLARNERHLRKLTDQKEEEVPRRRRGATPPDIPPSDNEGRVSDEESVYAVTSVYTKPKGTVNHKTHRVISQDTQSNTLLNRGVTDRNPKYMQGYTPKTGYKMVRSENTTNSPLRSILKSGSTQSLPPPPMTPPHHPAPSFPILSHQCPVPGSPSLPQPCHHRPALAL